MSAVEEPGTPGRVQLGRGPILKAGRLGGRGDDLGLYSATFLFSLSLAMASVALPLLAIEAGYHASEIGVLVALSAVTQIATRWVLAGVMRRVSNATIVTAAAVTLGVSTGLPALSTALAPMVAASLVQGLSRACFWTGSQTHVVRSDRRPASGIAWLNLIASAAMVVGPVTAGVIADSSSRLAFVVATTVACAGILPTLLMDRPPPFEPGGAMGGEFVRRPGVAMGASSNAVAGAWRGLLASYVPVALESAGRSSVTIGGIVTVANSASIAGSFLAVRVSTAQVRAALFAGSLLAGIATMVVGYGGLPLVVIGTSLAIGGVAVGVLQVLGVTVASASVAPQLRGDAVAVTGTFRAAALFASPMGVAALLPVVGIGPAVLVMASLMLLPAPVIARAGHNEAALSGARSTRRPSSYTKLLSRPRSSYTVFTSVGRERVHRRHQ